MIEQIWETIREQLTNNNFLSGGAVLMVGGWLLHIGRSVPATFFRWLRDRFVLEIDVPDRSESFAWINKWLADRPYTQNWARLLTVITERDDDRDTNRPNITLTLAPGTHWMIWRRRLLIVTRERKDSKNETGAQPTSSGSGFRSLFPVETFNIKIFARNREFARLLLEEARNLSCPESDPRLTVYTTRYPSQWDTVFKRRPRPHESVVLDGDKLAEMRSLITDFFEKEEWYIEQGLPHRLGFLLKGPPGSGKSSSVLALASWLKMDIAILNLANKDMCDNDLMALFMDLPKHAVVLIEDIDCAWSGRENSNNDRGGVTFSGLLNAIDGVASGEGRVLFMTTNHVGKLDPALIRPGRVDHEIEIGHPTASQICRIFERFFPDVSPALTLQFVDASSHVSLSTVSMAALQGHLTKYSKSAEDAVRHAGELFHKQRLLKP